MDRPKRYALAIELTAPRVKALSISEIAARLDDCFGLLTSAHRTELPRHQTLRATIDWSYDLLTDKEQVLLNRLSVFSVEWTLQAAEAVVIGGPIAKPEVLDLLSQPLSRSRRHQPRHRRQRHRSSERLGGRLGG